MDKKINLIGVNSRMGGGKDTFLKIFNKLQGDKWKNKKFAEKLKQATCLFTGCKREDLESEEFKDSYLPEEWSYTENGVEKRMTYRYFMQKLGTEGMRDGVHKNIHVNALFADYKKTGGYGYTNDENTQTSIIENSKYPNWVLTDLRFPNEYASIIDRGGICIKIERYQTFIDWAKSLNIEFISIDDKISLNELSELCGKINKTDFLKIINDENYQFDKKEEFFEKHTHASEILLNSANFHYVIKNDGTLEDFQNKVKDFIKTYEL